MMGIFLVASASAADLNETLTSNIDDSNVDDTFALSDSENAREDLSIDVESENSDILTANHTPKDADDIQNCIDIANDGDTIVLDGYYLISSTINVNKSMNFVGINNAIIDGDNSGVRLFKISHNGVSFKNITFINAKSTSSGSVIYFEKSGSVVNCSFINNSETAILGIYSPHGFGTNVENCSFINNHAKTGGALEFCNALNCTFIGNSAKDGGAMYVCNAVNCTFINNSATESGGATYQTYCVGCWFINNSNSDSEDLYSDLGGGAMNRGNAKNCTFINNSCVSYGGAATLTDCVDCWFINNSGIYGGAINLGSARNCTFISNSGYSGGALRDASAINCTFINNSADFAMKFVETDGSAINCTFINNENGVYSNHFSLNNKVIDCTFINTTNCAVRNVNTIHCMFVNNSMSFDAGSMLYSVINSTFINNSGISVRKASAINCSFINNTASAIYDAFDILNCSFINNHAENGGAIQIADNIVNCTFINNSAEKGGAVDGIESIVGCKFINNTATYGGAVYGSIVQYVSTGYQTGYNEYYCSNVYMCTFINNTATYGGAMYCGNAINCSFINCSADYGGAIYINQSENITGCAFSNCTSLDGDPVVVDSSQIDYLVQDCIFDEYPTNIEYHYVSSLISGNLTYFNGEEGILLANLSDIRGVLNNQIVYLSIGGKRYNVTTDSNGIASFNIQNYLNKAGEYDATVIFEGDNVNNPSSTNVTITVNKHDSILNVPELVLYKNEYGILIGNLNNARGPLANKSIVFTLDGVNYRRNTDQNGVVEFNVLNYLDGKGKFDLNVTFGGDDFNNPASTNVSVYIIDFRGILTCNVDGKYFNDTILVFSLINYKNNKPIYNAPIKLVFSNGEIVNLTTDVDGSASYRMPFRPGNYDVTAYVDQEYVDVNNITIQDIEINKMFGQISHELLNGNKTLLFKLFNPVNLDVFRNVKINLAFNNQVTAEIITNDAGIAVYDIPFPKGIYSVYIRVNGSYTQFQEDHINNIVVTNDLNCSLNFTNNITFAFGEYGSTDFTVEGGTVELDKVKVIDHPEALISISNNTISVFGLSVGNYVLEVETTPDEYHNAVIGRVNITVTNAPSKVTFSTGLLFEYGGSISINVVVIGGFVERKNIKIVGHPEANIILKGNVITISGLAVGNYKLQVTSTPDSDHIASTETVSVTVKKATAVIKASKITVAYKKAGQWTIKFADSKSGNAISNMMVTLKVYTGKKFKTVSLKTNSKGEATYQTKKLAKGTHKVVVSAKDSRYNFNTFTSSIKVIKQTAVKFKVTKKTLKDGASLSITVKNKKTKKPINGVKIKLLIYTGSKLTKTVMLKTLKKGKFSGVAGYATNELKAGKHKVKITTADIKYGGSAKSSMKITKQAKKYPALSTKISAKI